MLFKLRVLEGVCSKFSQQSSVFFFSLRWDVIFIIRVKIWNVIYNIYDTSKDLKMPNLDL